MNIAIILSGGTGMRMGQSVPKQYLEVNQRMIISYSIETMIQSELFNRFVVVANPEWREKIEKEFEQLCKKEIEIVFANPGENRQLSILNGLEEMAKNTTGDAKVIIHDAARPLVSANLLHDCIDALDMHDGVMPVLPVKDTTYVCQDGRVEKLLERKTLFAGQAPEGFWLCKYLEANRALLPDKILKINGSTEPAVLAGLDVAMIPGDEGNFKITTMEDLKRFEMIMNTKE